MLVMTREELVQKVEELEGWLAEFNKVHASAPQEFRSNVDRAFLEMADKLEKYKRVLRDIDRQLGYLPSEVDSGSNNEDRYRGPRASAAASSPSNRSEYYSPSVKSTEY